MASYKCKAKAETWKKFEDGVLSTKLSPIQIDTEIIASEAGKTGNNEVVLKINATLFTKLKWFNLIPVSTSPVPPTPTPPALGEIRKLRIWGDPVMTAWGYDVKQVGLSNWQNIALWNEFTQYGAINSFLNIDREGIDYLYSIQFDGLNGVGTFHNKKSKMNWLCRDIGAIYLDAANWETASITKWGTTGIGKNNVTVDEYKTMYVLDKSTGRKQNLVMARVRGFRKSDMGRPLDDLLKEGLVHQCYCVNLPNNGLSETPKGIIYSPLWSPLDWDFSGNKQPKGFWIPEVLMEARA